MSLLERRLERSLKLAANPDGKKGQEKSSSSSQLRLTAAQKLRRELKRESFEQVQSLYEQGISLQEIARIVGIDKNTLRYFVQSQPWALARPHRGREAGEASLVPYLPYLHKRVARLDAKTGCNCGGNCGLAATVAQLRASSPTLRCCDRFLMICSHRRSFVKKSRCQRKLSQFAASSG